MQRLLGYAHGDLVDRALIRRGSADPCNVDRESLSPGRSSLPQLVGRDQDSRAAPGGLAQFVAVEGAHLLPVDLQYAVVQIGHHLAFPVCGDAPVITRVTVARACVPIPH